MFNRLTVNALLKSAILSLATAVIIVLALGAWDSRGRLNVATRMVHVADASSSLFSALRDLRNDRSTTVRDLQADKQGDVIPMLREAREAELTALNAALVALREDDLGQGNSGVPALDQALKRQVVLHRETAAAFAQPKASRRPGLVQETLDSANALMALIDKLSMELAVIVKLDDVFVSQLLEIKQQAWVTRNTAGDANLILLNGVGGMPMAADAATKYNNNIVRADAAWTTLAGIATGLPLSPALTAAMQKAKKDYFNPEHAAIGQKTLKGLVAGEKTPYDQAAWNNLALPPLANILNVAFVSLQNVKDYAVDMRASAQFRLSVQLGLLAAALVLVLGTMVLISRRVIGPLQMIQSLMLKLAGGNFNVELPRVTRQDEVGQIVASVNTMVEQIRTAIGGIKTSAREVTNASAEISESTTDLSQRTEEQAASLEETTASMEEISTTVRKNAENAKMASDSAASTRAVADRGGEVAAKAVKAMSRIEESSGKIADIIGVIDEIARQTNLLALNAAVEAARAGDAGRGFAVVATEVRSLAQRSSQAAKDISHLITNSSGQVKEGVSLVNQAGAALNEIVDSIRTVAAVVSDIATASSEQTTGLDEINKALSQMDDVTQRNSALVEENAATAKTLEQLAKLMDEQVAFFLADDANMERGAQGGVAVSRRPASNRTPTARTRSSVAAA
jgi:methyl-accepting chemotaxis protein